MRENPDSFDLDSFLSLQLFTYVLLNEHTAINSVIDTSERFLEKHYGEALDPGESFELMATPLSDIRYRSSVHDGLPSGNMVHLYVFGTVAVFFLIIAAINYINMATACAGKREKEVGIRKVMGHPKAGLSDSFSWNHW